MFQNRSDRARRVLKLAMVRLATAILLAAGLVLASSAPGLAKPAFRFVGDAKTRQLESDSRHLAFERPDGVIAVYDAGTGRFSAHPPPEPGCPYRDVGGGKLMWSCGSYPLHVVIKKLRTGQVRSLDVAPGEISGSVAHVGTYWVAGSAGDHRGGHHDAWWSLVDGRSRGGSADPREIEDLDLPGLVRPLCSPLRRRPNPNADDYFDFSPFLPYSYDGRFGLTWDGAWELDECGRKEPRVLPEGATGATLVAGRVSWTANGKVVLYDAVARRYVRWGLRGIDPAAENAAVRLTRNRIFVSTVRPGEPEAGHLYMARLPKTR